MNTYGIIKDNIPMIEKQKIEKILTLLSNEIYAPQQIEFQKDFISNSDIIFKIIELFGM